MYKNSFVICNASKFLVMFGGLVPVAYFWFNKLNLSMEIKRLSDTMITVDNIVFEYNDRTLTYHAVTAGCTHKHILSLNHFLATENPIAEKEYCDYLEFVKKLYAELKDRNICLER